MDAQDLLRSARLARGISIDQVITETRMSPRIVHALDEGRFSDLPAGIYARSYVRAFAKTVGLDREAVERIAPLLPDTADPLPIIRDIVVEQAAREARARTRTMRLGGAAIIDALVLVAIHAAAVESAARMAGTSGGVLASASPIPLALVFIALAAIYFVLLAGISGATVGTRLFGVDLAAPAAKLDCRTIGQRAAHACLMEASVVVTIGHGRGIPRSESDRRFTVESRATRSQARMAHGLSEG